MSEKLFDSFRLVGGTSLSLQLGHRLSVDIDLFTDKEYDSIRFDKIEKFFQNHYNYVDIVSKGIVGMGKSYYIGTNQNNAIKLDLFYTDPFIHQELIIDQIRMADVEEIIAMKVDIISRGGRKKDFWDLHELMGKYTFNQMATLHKERYPYTHNKKLIRTNFADFDRADEDPDPICLRQKYWEVIKLDMIEFALK